MHMVLDAAHNQRPHLVLTSDAAECMVSFLFFRP